MEGINQQAHWLFFKTINTQHKYMVKDRFNSLNPISILSPYERQLSGEKNIKWVEDDFFL